MRSSGKLVILGILALAVASAAASWWFRYAATHRAAQFWGPENARLIRDAPIVELYFHDQLPNAAFRTAFKEAALESAAGRDISTLPGLVHLRNALLEDQSFHWPPEEALPGSWGWVLVFRNTQQNQAAAIFITRDWRFVSSWENTKRGRVLSCEPIADGLSQMLGEVLTDPPWR